MKKVSWGVLSTAKIGIEKVIPAMQKGSYCDISAIASRDIGRAKTAAKKLGISRAYGSYEALLADEGIEAVYIPLPNNLHVEWAIKALEAGKHVLCEKPIGMNIAEAERLLAASRGHPDLKIMEAFMYRFHPQWSKARQLITDGGIGELKTIQTFYSYNNLDPANIRNRAETGGGGLMDIGCYCISLSRFLFDAEPRQVLGIMDYDPAFGTDRLASGILDFGSGTSTFTCGTQLTHYQRVTVFGDAGRFEMEIPFNAPPDRPCRMWHQTSTGVQEILFDVCDQYTIQGDAFSQAVLNDTDVPTPLTDAVANMRVIEAVIASAHLGRWQRMNAPMGIAAHVGAAGGFRGMATRQPGSTIPYVPVLTLHPSPLDSGKTCSLIPSIAELKDGDAAALYHQAGKAIPEDPSGRIWNNVWVPFHEFSPSNVQAFLKKARTALQLVNEAIQCKTCTWAAFDPANPPQEELTRLRLLMFLICLQARSDMAERQYDSALDAIRTGVAMARQVGNAPVTLQSCLGLALARMALQRVADMAQAPNSPNLYIALRALPKPLIDVGKAMQRESDEGYEQVQHHVHRLNACLTSLQCIETLRHYAALHNRQLPAKLSDIADVQLPNDPAIGKSITYRLEGTKAVLEVSPPKAGTPGEGMQYEITVAP